MADADGPALDAVAPTVTDPLAHIAERPWQMGFYQAMRLLEAAFADRPRLGRSARPGQDAVRLAQEPGVQFAPASLAAVEPGLDGRPPRVVVNFFGLFGPDGPLPLHLTEYARDRRRNFRDPTLQRFADIFHHRALSLLWRAWADSRPTLSFDRPDEDRFAQYVGALCGLGMESLRDRDAMPHLTKLHFAGRFANQTRHAEGLAAILSSFFTMAVRVDCFIGAWLTLPVCDRTALGDRPQTGTLGGGALVGGRVWTKQQKFRIVMGPVGLADYVRLLPGGGSLHKLIPIVRNYAGDVPLWDVNLILKRDEVPPIRLGRQGRLGWSTWLMPRRRAEDAADLFLDASADSMGARIDRETQAGKNPFEEEVT